MTSDSLQKAVSSWDGKSAEDIEAVYTRFKNQPGLVETLIEFMVHTHLQMGASWLLKAHLENNNKIDALCTHRLIFLLPDLVCWQAKLHVLQCLPYLDLLSLANKTKAKNSLHIFLKYHLQDDNKFVRAWTYNGLFLLAQRYPEFQQETKQILKLALQDEPASVKARIRQVINHTEAWK